MSKPFVPAWVDDADLSPAEFRIYMHLCRRADNTTGVAWPSYDSMTSTCGMGKSTVRRSLEALEGRHLIAKAGKPFGGSCRYRILFSPIVPSQGGLETANSSTSGTIETPQIVPSQDCNSPSDGTPIVPPEGQEGSPIRISKEGSPSSECSPAGFEYADWFKGTLPASVNLPKNWRTNFAKTFDDLVRIDGLNPAEIRRVSEWARASDFWSSNFMSPLKLRKRNKDGIRFFDVFAEKAKPSTGATTTTKTLNLGRRGHSNSYNETSHID